MKKTVTFILLVFSAVSYTAPPILANQKMGKNLDNLSANQHDRNLANNPFGWLGTQHLQDHLQDSISKRNNPITQYGNQYLQDSINKRNNPVRYNAVIVKFGNPFVGQGKVYLQDSINKRNNPGGKYYERVKILNNDIGNVTNPHREMVVVPLYSW